MLDLVGHREAGLILGVTAERVRQLHKAGRFATPIGQIGRSPVWLKQDVDDFCRRAIGREPIPITTNTAGQVIQQVLGQEVLIDWSRPEHP